MGFNPVDEIINTSSLLFPSLDTGISAFFKFEFFPLIDEISGAKLKIEGSQSPLLEAGAFGEGLRMRPSSFISYSINTNNDQFSLGFWLNPVNVKPAINPINSELIFFRLSLIDRAKFQFDSITNEIFAVDASFVIMEECREDNKNVLIISLFDENEIESVHESKEYTAGELHHFWISYLGISKRLILYIDGIFTELLLKEGFIPSKINISPSTPLHINFSGLGNNTLLRNNFGLIDEFVFSSLFLNDETTIGKYINLGVEFVIDESELFSEEVFTGFIFNDPTSITATSVVSNGTNVYIGRDDGGLFRGNRTMWQSSRDFSDIREKDFISKNILSAGGDAVFQDGNLRIEKSSIRFR